MPNPMRLLLTPGWLVLAWSVSACSSASGTPTPEPPDHLPPPEIVLPTSTPTLERDARGTPLPPAILVGQVGSGQDAWVVNLDAPETAPQRATADASGAFSVEIRDARAGDRLRVVARSDTRHSLPLDLRVGESRTGAATFQAAADEAIRCVIITPEEVTEVVEAETQARRAFRLENRCGAPVSVTRTALRLGGVAGFALGRPLGVVPPGADADLGVTVEGHALPSEQADVVLLELALGARTARYALGVYSVSASSIGKP